MAYHDGYAGGYGEGIFATLTYEQPVDNRLGQYGLRFTVGKIVYICTDDVAHETDFIMGKFDKQICSHGVGIKAGSGDNDLALFRRGRDYPVSGSERTILEDAGYSIG